MYGYSADDFRGCKGLLFFSGENFDKPITGHWTMWNGQNTFNANEDYFNGGKVYLYILE